MSRDSYRSFNLNPWVLAFCVSVFVLMLQIVVGQYIAISGLRQDNAFHKQARGIESETIRDLMYELDQVKTESELRYHRGYVSGIVDTVNRPDYYTQIWHSGYSRGAEVQQYADALDEKETQYTKETTTEPADPKKE
jgi:hypothetical protein